MGFCFGGFLGCLTWLDLTWLRRFNLCCRRFIRRCKQGVLQFVILKPLLVLSAFILYYNNKYEEGSFYIGGGYLYITLIYTMSYSAALGALVLFYVACRDLLTPYKALPKFILVKSVVFLTYWQVSNTFHRLWITVPKAIVVGPFLPLPVVFILNHLKNLNTFIAYGLIACWMRVCTCLIFVTFGMMTML